MINETDWERLARYVSGEAGSEERAEVERWLGSDPGRRAALDDARRRWEAAQDDRAWNVDAAWAAVAPRLRATPAEGPRAILLPPRHRFQSAWLLPLAAGLVLAAGLAIWRAVRPGDASLGAPAVAAAEHSTGTGERRTVNLPDGSIVVLGARSTLRVADGYGAAGRVVFLEGQALFRVTHDSARPFRVHAAGTVSEDLGTEFEVRAVSGQGAVRVIVASGSVQVRREAAGSQEGAVLHPRDVATIQGDGPAVVAHEQNVERLLAWTSGGLAFDDVALPQVCRELERWYDIDCRVADDAAGSRHYTGDFPAESLDEVLRVIDLALDDVRVVRAGRIVTFERGSAGRGAAPARRGAGNEAGA